MSQEEKKPQKVIQFQVVPDSTREGSGYVFVLTEKGTLARGFFTSHTEQISWRRLHKIEEPKPEIEEK